MRDDLVTRVAVVALADIAVAERRPRQHVDRAGLGPVGLATAGPLQNLSPLVLSDHPLELHQQRVLGAVTARALDEHHGGAGPAELLDQQRLVGILAGQPVRGIHQQHVHWNLADQVTQPLQGWADQAGPGMAIVFKHPLLGHVQTQPLSVCAQRRGLGPDRLLLLLAGRGDPGVDRCVAHQHSSLPDPRARCARVVRGPGCGMPPTVPPPAGDRRRTRSRPPAGSPARALSMRPRQELLQRLRDHRRQRAARSGGVRPDPPDERHRQLDGEHRGRIRHRHMPGPAGALQVSVSLSRRATEPAGKLSCRLRGRHPRAQQVRGSVDPFSKHITTSATSRPTTRHVTNVLLNMSYQLC